MSRSDELDALFCARCGAVLTPGEGNLYVVRIEAFADPTPGTISGDESPGQVRAEIDRLLEQIRGLSQQELMDQVHRRLVLYLCGRCYRQWIEASAGSV